MTNKDEYLELTRKWGVYKYALASLKNARYVLGEFDDQPYINEINKTLQPRIKRLEIEAEFLADRLREIERTS